MTLPTSNFGSFNIIAREDLQIGGEIVSTRTQTFFKNAFQLYLLL